MEKIRLVGFGKFADKSIELKEGINIILGDNEAGKSTVQSSIKAAFFGKPKDYQTWAGGSGRCLVEIGYRHGGRNYVLVRDLESGGVSVEENGGKPLTKKSAVLKLIASHLGIGDEGIFENTLFVRTNEIRPLTTDGDAKKIKNRIEILLTGSRQVPVTKAIQDLDNVYRDEAGLKGELGKGGKIGELIAGIDGLKGDLENQLNDEKEYLQSKEQMKRKSSEIEKKTKEKEELLPVVRAMEAKAALDKIKLKRQTLSKKIETVEAWEAERSALERELDSNPYRSITADQERDIIQWQDKIVEIGSSLSDLRERFSNIKDRPAVFRIGAASSFVLASAAAALTLTVSGFFALASGLLVFLSIFFLVAGRIAGKKRTELAEEIEEADLRHKDVSELRRKLLESVGAESRDDFTQGLALWREKQRESLLLKEKVDIRLEGASLEALKDKRRELLDDEERSSREIGKSLEASLENVAVDDLLKRKLEIERLETETSSLLKEGSRLEGRLEVLKNRQLPDETEDDIAYLNDRLLETELKAEALALAGEELRESFIQLSKQAVPVIESKARDLFRRFTADDSRELSLNNELAVSADGKEGANHLSTGTGDQAYLALRLAMIDLICGDAGPPLILDDSFAFFDDDRLESVKTVLEEIGKEQQVILFSHDRVYEKWPGHHVFLEGRGD